MTRVWSNLLGPCPMRVWPVWPVFDHVRPVFLTILDQVEVVKSAHDTRVPTLRATVVRDGRRSASKCACWPVRDPRACSPFGYHLTIIGCPAFARYLATAASIRLSSVECMHPFDHRSNVCIHLTIGQMYISI